jgi:hypothetical protein
MTLVTAFIAGKAAPARSSSASARSSPPSRLRNGFMMVRGGFMVIGPIIGAIGLWPIVIGAAIAAVAYLVYANWDKIKAAFSAGWAAIKSSGPPRPRGCATSAA